MTPIRTAVVGVGHLGRQHARVYSELKNACLVGVVDCDMERAAQIAQEYETRTFPNVSSLIAEGVDAASVAVPTTAHGEITLQLLDAGVDVLVEKPIAPTLQEADTMVAKAVERQRILQVGHIERFNGAVTALLHAIKEPKFIECHRLSPYPNRGHDVSVVLDLMIHDIDIVLAMVQSEVVSVDAVGVPVFSEHEDIANARIRFASGCVANLTSSRVSMDRMRKIRVFGSNAYVSTNYTEQEVLVYRKKPGAVSTNSNPMELISVEPLAVQRDEPLRLELAAFIESVKNRTRPVVSGEDGRAALRLALEATEFIRNNA